MLQLQRWNGAGGRGYLSVALSARNRTSGVVYLLSGDSNPLGVPQHATELRADYIARAQEFLMTGCRAKRRSVSHSMRSVLSPTEQTEYSRDMPVTTPWLPATAAFLVLAALLPVRVAGQTASGTATVRVYGGGDSPQGRWRIGSEPIMVIGGPGATESAEFRMIGAIAPLGPGGRGGIAIADILAAEIKVFDSRGRYVRTMGRRGRGPGEFGGVFGLWRIGDSLAAMDEVGVVHVFGADGRYVRTEQRPLAFGQRVIRLGYLYDGSLIGHVLDPAEETPRGRSIRFLTLLRIMPDGSVHRLGRFPGLSTDRKGVETRPETVVYGPQARIAVLSDRICIGFPDGLYAFTCLDAQGKAQVNVSRKTGQGRLVTDADKETYFHLLDSANSSPRNAESRRRRRITTVFAERMSPFGRIIGSDEDELWVGPVLPAEWATFPNPVPPGPTVWSVYSKEGEWLSEVTFPARFRLVAVNGGRVIGLVLEPGEGIETIVAFPLLRQQTRPELKGSG